MSIGEAACGKCVRSETTGRKMVSQRERKSISTQRRPIAIDKKVFRNLFYRVYHVLGSLIHRECASEKEREREGETVRSFCRDKSRENRARIKIDEIIPMHLVEKMRDIAKAATRARIWWQVCATRITILLFARAARFYEHATPSRDSKTIDI